jgi:transcriptional regulator with XRE-family HTH domain
VIIKKKKSGEKMNKNNIVIENRLHVERVKKGFTQGALATKLGVSKSTYSKWEKNFEGLPISKGRSVAEALDIDINDLII